MNYVIAHSADIGTLILAILGVFSLIAKLTPTEADNKLLDKIYSVVHLLGLTK